MSAWGICPHGVEARTDEFEMACPQCHRAAHTPTFNQLQEQADRDKAIARADRHSQAIWRSAASHAIRTIAARQQELTSEDLLAELELRHVATHENRALGAVMLAAQRQNLIAPTDRFTRSQRPGRHLGPVRVWTSLIGPAQGALL